MTTDTGRPLRADARRNREKILSAAVRVFAEDGLEAHLERIAKEAGVGSGTLYRNFPTREALIEAAYRNELSRLCDAAPDLLAAMPPREALRAWMGRFIDYATAKLGMAEALRAVVDSGVNPYAHSRELMMTALTSLLDAATAAGTIRRDITPADMFAALTGVALASGKPEQREQAERILDLILDGLGHGTEG
ncbi:TetR/AcrR family transcriptional regulator [Streptomyces alfalfae]|uniref:TetR/AcrR family transcriptional regulator n=1 Tax=Streptomyces alfalfae TaxID=1642299 RepID=A0A7T4TW10_9ACTN|nr:TetR/AcrR family transcriptional regulator [Streptomyces alfalfae]QQC87168.1 TetR/AcrR family transcriptional regulator [Streptomyces alfalfae]